MASKMRSSESSRLLGDPNVEIIVPTADNLTHLSPTRRVTRSLSGRTRVTPTAPTPAPVAAPSKPKAKGKAKATTSGGASSFDPNSPAYPVVIEYCTSDKKFLEKAKEVQKAIEAAAFPGVVVHKRKRNLRSGCFEIWLERTGQMFISRVGLEEPYEELTDIKADEVVEAIALFLKTSNRRALRMRAINWAKLY